jgi:hypothetical protein
MESTFFANQSTFLPVWQACAKDKERRVAEKGAGNTLQNR